MLLGNFFTVKEKTITGTNVLATIDINASHQIFEGHFPAQPVVPGVCMMQMFKEMLEMVTGKKMQLRKADFIKFLTVINPLENPTIQAEFSFEDKGTDGVTMNGRLFKDSIIFLKFRGTFG